MAHGHVAGVYGPAGPQRQCGGPSRHLSCSCTLYAQRGQDREGV